MVKAGEEIGAGRFVAVGQAGGVNRVDEQGVDAAFRMPADQRVRLLTVGGRVAAHHFDGPATLGFRRRRVGDAIGLAAVNAVKPRDLASKLGRQRG